MSKYKFGARFDSGRNSFWVILDNSAQQIISLLVFFVIARFISPSEFAVMAVVHVFIFLIRQSVFDPLAHTLARKSFLSIQQGGRFFWFFLFVGALFSGLFLLFAESVSEYYGYSNLLSAWRLMSVVLFFYSINSLYDVFLLKKCDFKGLALKSVVAVLVSGVVGVLFALNEFGVYSLVAQQLVFVIISFLMLLARSQLIPGRLSFSKRFWVIFRGSKSAILTGGLGYLASNLDTFLLSAIVNSHSLGVYAFAKRVASAVYLVIGSSVQRISLAEFSSRKKSIISVFEKNIVFCLVLFSPFLVVASVGLSEIIFLFFGPAWIDAGPIIRNILFFYLFLSIMQVGDFMFLAKGEGRWAVLRGAGQIIILCSVLFLNFDHVYKYAEVFAALEALGCLLFLFYARKRLGFCIGRVWVMYKPYCFSTVLLVCFVPLIIFVFGLGVVSSFLVFFLHCLFIFLSFRFFSKKSTGDL